jgi:hypothetical protein
MPDLISIGPIAAVPLALAFIMNIFAEWALLSRESFLELALAKSVKAIIIPALIAAYALIIATAFSTPSV